MNIEEAKSQILKLKESNDVQTKEACDIILKLFDLKDGVLNIIDEYEPDEFEYEWQGIRSHLYDKLNNYFDSVVKEKQLSPISLFTKGSSEYSRLNNFAINLSDKFNDIFFTIEDVWFDYGAGILWTTLIGYNPNEKAPLNSWQALYPEDQKIILYGTDKEKEKLMTKLYIKYRDHDREKDDEYDIDL